MQPTTTPRFDPRVSGLSQQVKTLAEPQLVYSEKARDVRAEYLDGALHLYRYEDILTINKHQDVLGNGGRGGSFGHDEKLIPLEIDGPEHKKWRRLLDPMFAPKRVQRLEDDIRRLAARLIDDARAEGGAEWYRAFCAPLPCQTFLGLVGAPLADLDFFVEFKEGVVHPKGETTEEIDANMATAGAKLLEYFNGFLADKRARLDRDDDVIAELMRSEVGGEPLTQADLINILFLLMFAGLDTVTSSLSCLISWLGRNPERRAEILAAPELLLPAVEELMRYESPVPSGMRFAQRDIDLGDGLLVPAGTQINAFWAAANVDPTFHEDPLRVDFHRERIRSMTFASGVHRCLGSHLARLELRIALETLLDRIPLYEIDADALTYNNIAVRSVTNLPVTIR
ncbi:cytochrome P450 [Actinomadura sp. LD22]|uniref:Cytochrome P450 n=1 Tax=Actinomadura physcomitrii TaxID=2650748 RepID=A0A6I4MJW2_9ACTN|nr:cytochrome P450 [Actinomadura physcomitrii]MWA04865.1 cytochrome P450 [Actinomadura physcomitrii]